jgi:hypothetical protein
MSDIDFDNPNTEWITQTHDIFKAKEIKQKLKGYTYYYWGKQKIGNMNDWPLNSKSKGTTVFPDGKPLIAVVSSYIKGREIQSEAWVDLCINGPYYQRMYRCFKND